MTEQDIIIGVQYKIKVNAEDEMLCGITCQFRHLLSKTVIEGLIPQIWCILPGGNARLYGKDLNPVRRCQYCLDARVVKTSEEQARQKLTQIKRKLP